MGERISRLYVNMTHTQRTPAIPIDPIPRSSLATTKPTRLYLIRHGRTDWNDEGRYQGQADPRLNRQGWLDAYAAALKLSDVCFDAVYASDLRRAQQTAHVFADLAGLLLQLDPRLREICQGEWQGLLISEIQERFPELFTRWKSDPLNMRLPGGETLRELENRLTAALDDIAAAHPGRTVAVFTHKLPIAILRCRARGLSLNYFWSMIPVNGDWQVFESSFERP